MICCFPLLFTSASSRRKAVWPLGFVLILSWLFSIDCPPLVPESQASALSAGSEPNSTAFRVNVPSHPNSLDPRRISPGQHTHIQFNVFAGLYRLHGIDQLKPDLAKNCEWSTIAQTRPRSEARTEAMAAKKSVFWQLKCQLKTEAKWSDGNPVSAIDVVRAFQSHFSLETKSFGIELLKSLKGFDEALKTGNGKRLAVRALSSDQLAFEFGEPDAEFLFKLAHPALFIFDPNSSYDPAGASRARYTGTLRVTNWSSSRIQTQTLKGPQASVEFVLVDDDEAALSLFRAGQLDLVRRVPTHALKSLKQSGGLHYFPVLRGDYVGFGPALGESPLLRKALALSLNYVELEALYESRGRPGCPSQERNWYQRDSSGHELCLKFDLNQAKEALRLSRLNSEPWWTNPDQKVLSLHFSLAGGDDIKKGMEWAQNQWKKHLGLQVELKGAETGVLTAQLRTKPPPLFRRGVAPLRPTCLATLEVFQSESRDNFIALKSARFDQLLLAMKSSFETKSSSIPKNSRGSVSHCRSALQLLVEAHRLIPLGQIHFVLLSRPDWTGWTLNGLGQLDLSELAQKLN